MDLRSTRHLTSLELCDSRASASQSAKQDNRKVGTKEVQVGNSLLAGVFTMKNSDTCDKLAVARAFRRDVR